MYRYGDWIVVWYGLRLLSIRPIERSDEYRDCLSRAGERADQDNRYRFMLEITSVGVRLVISVLLCWWCLRRVF
jgi:hypothetical protein